MLLYRHCTPDERIELDPLPNTPPPPLCRETNYSIPAHVYDEAAENNDVSLSLSVAFEYVFGIKEAGMLILQRIDSTRLSGTIILDLSPPSLRLSFSHLYFASHGPRLDGDFRFC